MFRYNTVNPAPVRAMKRERYFPLEKRSPHPVIAIPATNMLLILTSGLSRFLSMEYFIRKPSPASRVMIPIRISQVVTTAYSAEIFVGRSSSPTQIQFQIRCAIWLFQSNPSLYFSNLKNSSSSLKECRLFFLLFSGSLTVFCCIVIPACFWIDRSVCFSSVRISASVLSVCFTSLILWNSLEKSPCILSSDFSCFLSMSINDFILFKMAHCRIAMASIMNSVDTYTCIIQDTPFLFCCFFEIICLVVLYII